LILRAGFLADNAAVLPERLLVERSNASRFRRRLSRVEIRQVRFPRATVRDTERSEIAE
jgi:hypothetical protein